MGEVVTYRYGVLPSGEPIREETSWVLARQEGAGQELDGYPGRWVAASVSMPLDVYASLHGLATVSRAAYEEAAISWKAAQETLKAENDARVRSWRDEAAALAATDFEALTGLGLPEAVAARLSGHEPAAAGEGKRKR